LILLVIPLRQGNLTLATEPTLLLGQVFPPHLLVVSWLAVGLRPPYISPGQDNQDNQHN